MAAVCIKCEILERWLDEEKIRVRELTLENRELKDILFAREEKITIEQGKEVDLSNLKSVRGFTTRRQALHKLELKHAAKREPTDGRTDN